MKKKVFYLHVSYMCSKNGEVSYNDALVCFDGNDETISLNRIRDRLSKDNGYDTTIITSLTELSKDLFDVLNRKNN